MTEATIIGINLGKNVLQVHGAAPDRFMLLRNKLYGRGSCVSLPVAIEQEDLSNLRPIE